MKIGIIIKTLINTVLSIILTILLTIVLLLTHVAEYLFEPFRKLRGTANYVGEEAGRENLAVVEGIIMPVLLIISFIVVTKFMKKFYKRRSMNKKIQQPQ